MAKPGLGRVPHRDPRNERYRIRELVAEPAPALKKRHWWDAGWHGDQGQTSQCTAFSLLHYMADGPITHRKLNPLATPGLVYDHIQAVDRSEGRDYGPDGGATMLAQSKAAVSLGWYGAYQWGYTVEEAVQALLVGGPVILGINWYDDMFEPNKAGRIKVGGSIAGGHAIVCNGVNTTTGLVRLKNSWGKSYGVNGHCYLSLDDLSRLIAEDGEVVLPRELTNAKGVV